MKTTKEQNEIFTFTLQENQNTEQVITLQRTQTENGYDWFDEDDNELVMQTKTELPTEQQIYAVLHG